MWAFQPLQKKGDVSFMVSATVTIKAQGLHLRPTGVLCNKAIQYQSKITFQSGNTTASAKSVLSVLGACIKPGDEVTFFCEGEDEEEALQGILEVVRNDFEETQQASPESAEAQ